MGRFPLDAARARARDSFLAEHAPARGVRTQIAESWERSRLAGVDAHRVDVPYEPDLDFDGSLASCARPVLDQLSDQLSGTPVSVVLTDADGRLLDRRVGEGALRSRLDAICLAPGFCYAEEHAGTNGVGTALEGGAAALVVGAEHFTDRLRAFACAGAPVRGPVDQEVLGILDITCLSSDVNDLMPVLARRAALDIEQILLERGSRTAWAVMAEFRDACARTRNPLLAITDDVVMANGAARARLDAADEAEVRRRSEDRLTAPTAAEERVLLRAGPARLRFMPVPHAAVRPRGVLVEVVIGATPLSLDVPPGSRPQRRPRPPTGLAGRSGSWLASCAALRDASSAGRRTLVLGEAGTGRTAAVRAIHLEVRPEARFVVVECGPEGGVPDAALKDAFDRGPDQDRPAPTVVLRDLERADADEVSAVEEILDAAPDAGWLVAVATRDALDDASATNVLLTRFDTSVTVDPLRQRPEDVPDLIEAVLARLVPGRSVRCSPDAIRLLSGGLWPGNLAELTDVLRSAVGRRPVGDILPQDLPAEYAVRAPRRLTPLETVERDVIVRALLDADGNRRRAAAELGIGRATLYRRLRTFGITDVGR